MICRADNKPSSSLYDEIIVDLFAGGGGASMGIEQALGRAVDVAVNHDPQAVAMHRVNHPATRHYCEDVFNVDPLQATGGRRVGLMWASPDCKHFSKAKGGKPVSKRVRGLAWVVIRWARAVRPRVIMLENVEEFTTWGPLTSEGKPCPRRKGRTFRGWVSRLRQLGYDVQWREMRACDYGAPTIRKRLFLIARCDGQPIVWPAATHMKPPVTRGMKKWKTAADIIDWSIPCPSIFERKRTLRPATLRRIARGIQRYVINARKPFIVNLTHGGRVESVDDPMRTVTGANRGEKAVVTPILTEHANASSPRSMPADEPLRTQCAGVKRGHFAMVAPILAQYQGDKNGQPKRSAELGEPLRTQTAENRHALVAATLVVNTTGHPGSAPDDPLRTVTTGGHHALVSAVLAGAGGATGSGRPVPVDQPSNSVMPNDRRALVAAFMAQHNTGVTGHDAREPVSTITQLGTQQNIVAASLVKLRGTCRDGQPVTEPAPTLTAGGNHIAEVRAFLVAYYGNERDGQSVTDPTRTLTTKERLGLVTINGVDHQIVDIGMRMLSPRELFAAQGFPRNYVIDRDFDGKPINKTSQVRMCGNSVVPALSRALVAANMVQQPAEAVA